MKVKYAVPYEINLELTDAYAICESGQDVIHQVIDDWNNCDVTPDCDGVGMQAFLKRDMSKKGYSISNCKMTEDDGDSLIIEVEGENFSPEEVQSWIQGQMTDGFGEHEFTESAVYQKRGSYVEIGLISRVVFLPNSSGYSKGCNRNKVRILP